MQRVDLSNTSPPMIQNDVGPAPWVSCLICSRASLGVGPRTITVCA
jgi:hypothetical protein